MLTRVKRGRLSRVVLGRLVMGGVAAALMLTGVVGPAARFLAATPALADDRHDRDRDRDRRHYYHPYYAPPVYAPPPVLYAPPPPSPVIDFVFPIHIR
jgi:hypothetical protein